ncbi:MFS transporter [Microbacterium karelineae]|uniref:MFS transporter n=1 Tax=Microbacterium karelineae TaxID=2654283 RepID=UPI0012E9D1BF|nr:MFS transporter [Microbacterium karelineae]
MTDTDTVRIPPAAAPAPTRLRYAALVMMTLTSFSLVSAEFLPNGLLTDMAADLGVTPGQAGQTVTVTAFVGLIAAPTVGLVVPKADRRTLLAVLAAAAAVSNLAVAFAPQLWLILVARILLGIALSGFWAMSLSVSARIAGPEHLGRAVMFTTAGVSLATVAGVPIGVLLSSFADWRAVFVAAAVVTAGVALGLRILLPSVPAEKATSIRGLVDTLRRPGLSLGLVGHVLIVFGHVTAYTYIRLALERVSIDGRPLDEAGVVLMLVLFGAGGLVGNVATGALVDRHLGTLRAAVPMLVAASILVALVGSGSAWVFGIAVFVWGTAFGGWLIVLNAWIGRHAPDRLESGGALVVVGFQLAIVLAAGLGGLIVDLGGVPPTYALAAICTGVGTALFVAAGRGSGAR